MFETKPNNYPSGRQYPTGRTNTIKSFHLNYLLLGTRSLYPDHVNLSSKIENVTKGEVDDERLIQEEAKVINK